MNAFNDLWGDMDSKRINLEKKYFTEFVGFGVLKVVPEKMVIFAKLFKIHSSAFFLRNFPFPVKHARQGASTYIKYYFLHS